MNQYLPFFVSLLIGFLIGLEREKTGARKSAMGVRTFTLLALLGALCGWMQQLWLTVLFSGFSLVLVVAASLRLAKDPRAGTSLTTQIAAGAVFLLGLVSHRDPAFAALLGVVIALLLFWKTPLHRFSEKAEPREIQAALLIFLLGICVLSFLNDKTIDPWGLFNPRKLGIVVLAIAAIEFFSYLATKFLDPAKSPLVIGGLAGLVSSTALHLTTAKAAGKDSEAWRQKAATVVVGQIAAFMQLVVVVGLVSRDLIPATAILVSVAAGIGGLAVFFLLRGVALKKVTARVGSPLDIQGVLRLSLILGLSVALVAFSDRLAGELGRKAASFLAGLFELHAVSLAASTLHAQGKMSAAAALATIEVAILASMVAKIGLSWAFTRGKFSWAVTVVFAAMGVSTFFLAQLVPLWLGFGEFP